MVQYPRQTMPLSQLLHQGVDERLGLDLRSVSLSRWIGLNDTHFPRYGTGPCTRLNVRLFAIYLTWGEYTENLKPHKRLMANDQAGRIAGPASLEFQMRYGETIQARDISAQYFKLGFQLAEEYGLGYRIA